MKVLKLGKNAPLFETLEDILSLCLNIRNKYVHPATLIGSPRFCAMMSGSTHSVGTRCNWSRRRIDALGGDSEESALQTARFSDSLACFRFAESESAVDYMGVDRGLPCRIGSVESIVNTGIQAVRDGDPGGRATPPARRPATRRPSSRISTSRRAWRLLRDSSPPQGRVIPRIRPLSGRRPPRRWCRAPAKGCGAGNGRSGG